MKFIKTHEGFLNTIKKVLKMDYTNIEYYLDYFKDQSFNYDISYENDQRDNWKQYNRYITTIDSNILSVIKQYKQHVSDNNTTITYKVTLNDKEINSNYKNAIDLFELFSNLYKHTNTLTDIICNDMAYQRILKDSENISERAAGRIDPKLLEHIGFYKKDFNQRAIEFEIIRNGEVDFINLNKLYDFYEIPFDENKISRPINQLQQLHKKE